MAIIGELIAKIHADTTTFDKNVDKAGNTLKEFNKKISETGMKMRETGGKIAMLASAPFLGVLITSLNKLKQSNDPANQSLKDIDRTIGTLQIDIARAFIPIIEEASKWIKDFAHWFGNLDEGTRKTIVTIGLLVAAIGPLIGIFGTIMSMGLPGIFIAIGVAVAGLVVALVNGSKANIEYFESQKKVQQGLENELDLLKQNVSERKRLMALLKENTTQTLDDFKNGAVSLKEALAIVDKQIQIESSKTFKSQTVLNALYRERNDIMVEYKKQLDDIKNKEKAKDDRRKAQLQKGKDDFAAIMKIQQQRWDKDTEEQNKSAELDAQITQQKIDDAKKWMNVLTQAAMPVFESLGAAIIQGGDAWEAFKKAGLNAIAQVIEAFAAMWIAQGVEKIAESIWPVQPLGLAAGAALLAAGASAYVVAGVVKNMKDGGLVMPQPGGTIVRIAEAGVPEYAVPDRKDIWAKLAGHITSQMKNMNIQNNFNPNFEPSFTIKISERELFKVISKGSRDGRVPIDPKRGIAKR